MKPRPSSKESWTPKRHLRAICESAQSLIVSLFADSPLKPPPLVAGICLLRDSHGETASAISRLERPPIHRYQLASELMEAVLRGRPFKWAMGQARASTLAKQRPHAIDLLQVCRPFIERFASAKVRPAGSSGWVAGPDFVLPVIPRMIVDTGSASTALFFHFWRTPLTDRQIRLGLGVAQACLWRLTGYAGLNVEIVTAPVDPLAGKRRLRVLRASDHSLPTDDEMEAFGAELSCAWAAYHLEHPTRNWRK